MKSTRGGWEYNPVMLSSTVVRVRIPASLDVATYISIGAMSLLAVRGLQSLPAQSALLGLGAICGLLYRFMFRAGRYEKNPVLYFGSQFAVLALMLIAAQGSSVDPINFIFLFIAIHAALVLTRNAAVLWIAAYYFTVSAAMLITHGTEGFYAAAFYLVTYAVSGVFGHILQQAELAREHNQQLVEELQSTQKKLQELAVVEERNRLARELHDSVKQQVFAISMQLSAARTSLSESDKAYSSITEAERLAQQAGAELTTLINALRPPVLESKSLTDAIKEYVNEWSKQNNIATNLRVDENLPLSANEEQAFFRVIQESLSNITRHSRATQVDIELVYEDSHILFCVVDNGKGFNVDNMQKGIGIRSMQERLSQIGAAFQVRSEKGHGTQITAKLRRLE